MTIAVDLGLKATKPNNQKNMKKRPIQIKGILPVFCTFLRGLYRLSHEP